MERNRRAIKGSKDGVKNKSTSKQLLPRENNGLLMFEDIENIQTDMNNNNNGGGDGGRVVTEIRETRQGLIEDLNDENGGSGLQLADGNNRMFLMNYNSTNSISQSAPQSSPHHISIH